MKAKIALLFLFLSGLIRAQQNQFIIGADWLNSNSHSGVLSGPYWDTIKSFNLNFGSLNINQSEVASDLDAANSKGIKIELNTYTWPLIQYTHARRWMYQIEGDSDFTSHQTGSDLFDDSAEIHWSFVKIDSSSNYIKLDSSLSQPGFVSKNLRNPIEIPDSSRYYVKLKIKKNTNAPDTTPVIRVRIIDTLNHHDTAKILIVRDFPNNNWNELDVVNFIKTLDGPKPVASPPIDDHIKINDSLGIGGIKDFVTTTNSYTPYDIEIYWYGLVNCDLDYITVEDEKSYNLHNHVYDFNIQGGADQYRSKPALYSYKLWDEPDPPNFLPLRYANNIINSRFSNGGSAYNNINISQQYLAQTQLKTNRCDVYPLGYYSTRPGQTNYTANFQDSLQINFVSHLIEEIPVSNRFSVPYWLTVQAHKWIDPSRGPILREPSAYEIKLMANLGIAYGAKGIEYFMYSKPNANAGTGFLDSGTNDVPITKRDSDDYGYDKWNIIKDLNKKLSQQGPMLMSLKWNGSYSIHDESIPSDKYITNIQSYVTNNSNIYETPLYAQLSFFADSSNDPNKERFFIINRRTLTDEQRKFKINYDISQNNPGNFVNWTIREFTTSNYWSGKDSGYFNSDFQPAEGKLFTLEPSVINGGDLNNNETVSGTCTLTGDLTIKPGVTLTISGIYNVQANITIDSGAGLIVSEDGYLNILSGSILSIADNISMTINGTLNANGSTFISNGPNNNWGSIIFDGVNSVNSVLNNVTIKHGDGIQCLNGADILIENSILDTCTNGIYIFDSQPTIQNNVITDPIENGISGESSDGSPLIQGNTIIRVTDKYDYQGIYLGNATCPTILNNNISGFCYGAYLGGGCITVMTTDGNSTCNNIIHNNYVGLCTAFGSETTTGFRATFGRPPRTINIEGLNSIFNNYLYDAYTYEESNLHINDDYWGSEAKFYTVDSSYVENDGVLNTNPCSSLENNVSNNGIMSNSLSKTVASDFLNGLLLEKQGNIDDAIALYKNLINSDTYVKPSLTRLAFIKKKYSRSDIIPYFENLFIINTKHYGKIKKQLGDLYMQCGRFDDAISTYNDIISNSSTSYDAINARFEKLFCYLHAKQNISMATQLLSEIKSMKLTEKEHLIRIQIADNLINRAYSRLNKNYGKTVKNIPITYSLSQNYPNPFNPSTVISYSLAKPDYVSIKIYDILGREVTTLVNEYKSEGNYTATFNASRFSSGVYIYQLRSGSFVDTKKMVLTK